MLGPACPTTEQIALAPELALLAALEALVEITLYTLDTARPAFDQNEHYLAGQIEQHGQQLLQALVDYRLVTTNSSDSWP